MDIKSFREKFTQWRKQSKRGDPLGASGFECFLEKVKKMKGGPFGLSLPWPELALGGFRNVSKMWTDQSEDCSLKKKSQCYSRAFLPEVV